MGKQYDDVFSLHEDLLLHALCGLLISLLYSFPFEFVNLEFALFFGLDLDGKFISFDGHICDFDPYFSVYDFPWAIPFLFSLNDHVAA
jgi:hypothetical protein